MKIKQENSYALHALMYMVRHTSQLPVTVQTISKAERIPYRQLVRLFRLLAEAGIVKNEDTGKKAGYVFGRPPSQVSLLELFELIEGEPIFQECFMKHCDCGATPDDCKIYALWKQASTSIVKKLSKMTIESTTWEHPEHYFK